MQIAYKAFLLLINESFYSFSRSQDQPVVPDEFTLPHITNMFKLCISSQGNILFLIPIYDITLTTQFNMHIK